MSSLQIFNQINSLSDLNNFLTLNGITEDYQIELKSVTLDLNSEKPSKIGDFKLVLAKEMSAFANTDSGIIAIGYDEKNQGILNNTDNLQEWLDKNIRHMLEPQLPGIALKTCPGQQDKYFVLMYVPKGASIPYRTAAPKAYELKKDNAREYFQRIGTHSEKISIPIVRSLYLSNDRATRFSARSKLIGLDWSSKDETGSISFAVEIQPDPTKLITQYYLDSHIMLLNENFEDLLEESISLGWWSINQPVIAPDVSPFVYNKIRISSEDIIDETFHQTFRGDIKVDVNVIRYARAAYIKTSYACDGVPKEVDNRIIVFGEKNKLDNDSWKEESNWIDERCIVVRYVSFGPQGNNTHLMYAMENYIRSKGLIVNDTI